MIPEFNFVIPGIGNGWTIGIAFQAHLIFVAFVMGIAIFAPVAEAIGLQAIGIASSRWERLAHSLGSTTVRLFSFAATWAVAGLILIIGLYPRLWNILAGRLFGVLIFIPILWLIMTLSAYIYYHSWDRLANRRGLHMGIGWTFAVSAFLFITIIVSVSSFQLTPTDSTTLAGSFFNPSWLPEAIHRHIGNVSYAGLILAGYSGIRLLGRRTEEDRAYYDWLGQIGLVLGVAVALIQPIVGMFFALQVQDASPAAFNRMMVSSENGGGPSLFLLQMLFFGATLTLGSLYLARSIDRAETRPSGASWIARSVIILAVLTVIGIIPKGLPLGLMTFKYIVLLAMMTITVVNLVIYNRARPALAWGKISRSGAWALIGTSITIILLLITMGIIRSNARGNDEPIHGRLTAPESQQIDPFTPVR